LLRVVAMRGENDAVPKPVFASPPHLIFGAGLTSGRDVVKCVRCERCRASSPLTSTIGPAALIGGSSRRVSRTVLFTLDWNRFVIRFVGRGALSRTRASLRLCCESFESLPSALWTPDGPASRMLNISDWPSESEAVGGNCETAMPRHGGLPVCGCGETSRGLRLPSDLPNRPHSVETFVSCRLHEGRTKKKKKTVNKQWGVEKTWLRADR